MPDVFVPRDTLANSKYLYELYARNIIREYAIRYATDHAESLEKQTFAKYLKTFKISDAMLADIVKEASRAGIEKNEAEIKRSRSVIQSQTKAIIARYIWGKTRKDGLSNEIYQVMNPEDNIYVLALTLFGQAENLEEGKLNILKEDTTKVKKASQVGK